MNGTSIVPHNMNMNMLKPLDETLRCPICSEFFNNCVMTHCMHDFCSTCIKKRLKAQSDCPICYEDLQESDLRTNSSMDMIVRIYKKLTSLGFLFCVVEFPKDDQPPSVVPTSWLEKDNEVTWCWYPTQDFRKHILKRSSPEKNWNLLQANALYFSREWKDSNDYLERYQRGSSFKLSEFESTPKKLKSSLQDNTGCTPKIGNSNSSTMLKAQMPFSPNASEAQESQSSNLFEAQVLACGSCEANSDTIIKVMEKLDFMSKQISGMKKTLTYLADKFSIHVDRIEIPDLPIRNLSDLCNVESLIENHEEFEKYVKYLGKFGGRDVNEATRRILFSLIDDSLAKQFNWIGGFGKTGFKQYSRIRLLIAAAVRETPELAEVKQLEVETIVKRWIRTALDRKGGRNHRKSSILLNLINLKQSALPNLRTHLSMSLYHIIIIKHRTFLQYTAHLLKQFHFKTGLEHRVLIQFNQC